MKSPQVKKILELLRSGNFSVVYTDNGECSLYDQKGITTANSSLYHSIHEFDNSEQNGYEPYIVTLLVTALGGESDSF